MSKGESPREAARRLAAEPISKGFKPEGLFAWPDEEAPLFYRVRLKHPITKEKWIRPMKLNGRGFALGEPDFAGKKPLFRCSDIESRPECVVWIVEGEPKVEALRTRFGLLATTSGGADSADRTDWSVLTGRKVMIWPDNDESGFKYASTVASILLGHRCRVKMVDVVKLNLPSKGDVIDWLDAHPGTSRADIEALPARTIMAQNRSGPDSCSTMAWEPPVLFEDIETPEIHPGVLPGIFGLFASELSEATETPPALAVMTILGVLSAILARRFVVSPKPSWYEPVNIYSIIALPPANNKSLVLSRCIAPLIEWEKEQEALRLPEIKRQRSTRKNQEKRIECLRAKAAKLDDIIERGSVEAEIVELEAALTEPMALPQLFINDVTPETFSNEVHAQGGRMAIYSDEGGIIETLSGLYTSGSANVDILLKGIDGGDVRIRRQTKSFNLNPFITIVLTVQPIVIQNMASKRAFNGNGLLERFLYVLPKSNLGFRKHNGPPVSAATTAQYKSRISLLLAQYETEPFIEPTVLRMSLAANEKWREFQAEVERDLRPFGRLSNCQGWGGKISGFALRIAGLLHIAEHDQASLEISESTMRSALELAHQLKEHAIVAYARMGVDEVNELAKWICAWILEGQRVTFTQAQLTLALRNKKSGKLAENRRRALQELVARGIIKAEYDKETRKPTTVYFSNPALFARN